MGRLREVDGELQVVPEAGNPRPLGDFGEFSLVGEPAALAARFPTLLAPERVWGGHRSVAPEVADYLEAADRPRTLVEKLLGRDTLGLFGCSLTALAQLIGSASWRLEGAPFLSQLAYIRGIGGLQGYDLGTTLERLAPAILDANDGVQEALGLLLAVGFPLPEAFQLAMGRFDASAQERVLSWSERAERIAGAHPPSLRLLIALTLARIESLPSVVEGASARVQQAETLLALDQLLRQGGLPAEAARQIVEAVEAETAPTPPTFAEVWQTLIAEHAAPRRSGSAMTRLGVSLERQADWRLRSDEARDSYRVSIDGNRLLNPKQRPLPGRQHLVIGPDGDLLARGWSPEGLWEYVALGCLSVQLNENGEIDRVLESSWPYQPASFHHALVLMALSNGGVDLSRLPCHFYDEAHYRFQGSADEYLRQCIDHAPEPQLNLLRLCHAALERGAAAEEPAREALAPTAPQITLPPSSEQVAPGPTVGDGIRSARGLLSPGHPSQVEVLAYAIDSLLHFLPVPLDELLISVAGAMGDQWSAQDRFRTLALVEILAVSPLASKETVHELLGDPTSPLIQEADRVRRHPEELVLSPNVSLDALARWRRRVHLSAEERQALRGVVSRCLLEAGVPPTHQARAQDRIERLLIAVQDVLPQAHTLQPHTLQVKHEYWEDQRRVEWEWRPPPTGAALSVQQAMSLKMLKVDLSRDGLPVEVVERVDDLLRAHLGDTLTPVSAGALVDEAAALFGHRAYVPPMRTRLRSGETRHASPVQPETVRILSPQSRDSQEVEIRDGLPYWTATGDLFRGGTLVFSAGGRIFGLAATGGVPERASEFRLLGLDAVATVDISLFDYKGDDHPHLSTLSCNYRPSSHHPALALLLLARVGVPLADWEFTPFGQDRHFDRMMKGYQDDEPARLRTVKGYLDSIQRELEEKDRFTPLDAITWLLLERRDEILQLDKPVKAAAA